MKPAAASPARAQAIRVLSDMLEGGRTLDEAWALHPFAGSEPDARFAMMLALTTLRHLGQLDALIANYLEKPLPKKRAAITNALRIGLAQLLLLDTPPHAAVHETVAAIKQGQDGALAGLVNAVLQKAVRDRPTLPAPVANLPAWLRARWEKTYGEEAVAKLAASAAQRPPLDINRADDMPGASRLDPEMLRLPTDHAPVESLPGYAEGRFFVQDIAASYPVRLLGDVRGKRVLDLCAAPGGKAMQLLARGAQVTALDRSSARMAVLQENIQRMRGAVNIVVADAMEWHPTALYDAILLDAPCSATGTWRRHPEVVQIVKPADITELAALQRQLLARAWAWVLPGGRLVYCVCSLEREEGEAQRDWFQKAHADAKFIPPDAATHIPAACIQHGAVRTLAGHMAEQGGMDGFYAICWCKKAA